MPASLMLATAAGNPGILPPAEAWSLPALLAMGAGIVLVLGLFGHWASSRSAARATAQPPPTEAAEAPRERPAEAADRTIPPEIRAVIAASVAAVCGPRARIVGLPPIAPHSGFPLQTWAVEGRRQIYTSHKIR